MGAADADFVFHSYDAGFIVLSYVVSVVGCWTSLELLHKRTSSKGLYNWYVFPSNWSAMVADTTGEMRRCGTDTS